MQLRCFNLFLPKNKVLKTFSFCRLGAFVHGALVRAPINYSKRVLMVVLFNFILFSKSSDGIVIKVSCVFHVNSRVFGSFV